MRKLSFILVLLFAIAPGVAIACPDNELWGERIRETSDDLRYGVEYRVIAGGENDLRDCRFPNAWREDGYVATRPDFTMQYFPEPNMSITFETQSDCDTVLLVNTADDNYFYDDDDGYRSNASITITNPSSGWYDIWVGTYGTHTCDAVLAIRTDRERPSLSQN